MSCWWRGECFAHLPGCSECVTWMIVSKFVSVKKGVVRKGNFHVEVGSGVFVLNKYFRFFFGVCMWEQLHTDLYLGAQTCAFNVITCYLVLVSESVVLCIQRGIYICILIETCVACVNIYIYIIISKYVDWCIADTFCLDVTDDLQKTTTVNLQPFFNKLNWCIEKKHKSIEHIFFKFSLANDYIYSWKKTVIYQKQICGEKIYMFQSPRY